MNATKHSPTPYAALGILAAFLIAVIWTVAAQNDPSWVLGESPVSDLAFSGVDVTADAFAYGLIVAGILVLVFGAGKARTEGSCSCSSGVMAAAAGVMLLLIGLGAAAGREGEYASTADWLFFVFMMLAIILSMFGSWQEGRRINAAVAAILVVVVIGAAVGKSPEYVQAVVYACTILWLVSDSAKMIMTMKAADEPDVRVETA